MINNTRYIQFLYIPVKVHLYLLEYDIYSIPYIVVYFIKELNEAAHENVGNTIESEVTL